jgi:hypothetical protein
VSPDVRSSPLAFRVQLKPMEHEIDAWGEDQSRREDQHQLALQGIAASEEFIFRRNPPFVGHRTLSFLASFYDRRKILAHRARQIFAVRTPIGTLKYSANLRIICRLNGFLPARTSETDDLAKPVC